MVRTGDIIALALAGAVVAAAWSTRVDGPPGPSPNPGPGPSPLPPSPADAEALRWAEQLVQQAELQVTYMTPEQRVEVARALEASADRIAPTSAQAASRLLDAAARIRRMNPTPIGAPTGTLEQRVEGAIARANDYLAGRTMGDVSAAAVLSELEGLAAEHEAPNQTAGALARRVVLAAYIAAVRNPQATAIFASPL